MKLLSAAAVAFVALCYTASVHAQIAGQAGATKDGASNLPFCSKATKANGTPCKPRG